MVDKLANPLDEMIRRGPWLEEEDEQLVKFVTLLGERRWDSLARVSGLRRTGKSCRLRWMNYLRPSLKHGPMSQEEERLILQLHGIWGNKWSKIARRLPGRTDNEIKNYWRTHVRKKAQAHAEDYDKVIDLSGETEDEYFVGEYYTTEKRIQEDRHFDAAKEVNQEALESDKETCGGIHCGIYNFGALSSPFESRVFDWVMDASTYQSEVKLVQDHSSSSSNSNNYNSCWLEENRDFEEFSCSLWT